MVIQLQWTCPAGCRIFPLVCPDWSKHTNNTVISSHEESRCPDSPPLLHQLLNSPDKQTDKLVSPLLSQVSSDDEQWNVTLVPATTNAQPGHYFILREIFSVCLCMFLCFFVMICSCMLICVCHVFVCVCVWYCLYVFLCVFEFKSVYVFVSWSELKWLIEFLFVFLSLCVCV